MYYMDVDRHKKPHIHARYQEHEAVIAIRDGTVLGGALPANKMKLVGAWVEIHREELMADWRLAVQGQKVFKIDPLR